MRRLPLRLPIVLSALVVGSWITSSVVPTEARAAGTWLWPVTGPVVRDFDPPASPYGSGHRGIDIAVAVGTPVVAPAAGTVSFAGSVGGDLFISLDHAGGLESTFSWVGSIAVHEGQRVAAGEVIGASGPGHPADVIASLHLGVKLDDVYVDPLDYLGPASVSGYIRLAA